MTAMGEWLKQIILLVILAALADLLLPTKAMQRYVRAVMGVAILAAMLQPFLPYLRSDWADRAAAAIDAELAQPPAGVQAPAAAGIEDVLKAQQAEAADDLLGRRLAEDIAEAFGGPAPTVRVTGAATGAAASVDIRIDPRLASQADAIAAWTADQLQIPRGRVTVHAG
ncbi:stage III sporulation protein AF [Alicyclobacillus macrosporangiidus]|uniref:Stage III sporulation protein AF n=1 Tax=Alicyclobacillus macrosporangiidus TaxID=392015 RepID=A0A1I7JXK8_9BACL|nr:stage III sporulation protein AF [Alicyclobacillus macrosporangiidus]SFU89884.1 stage III sporulation protein AF [Alicyclobacillus macrosporangiidus]